MTMKIMPDISPQERVFVKEWISGSSHADAWTRAFDPGEKATDKDTGAPLTYEQRKTRARMQLKKRRIKKWIAYLKDSTTEQLVEDLYVEQIAFGKGPESMKAANAFLESQFAGKEVAEIFLETLKVIQAEIVVPCQGRAEAAAV